MKTRLLQTLFALLVPCAATAASTHDEAAVEFRYAASGLPLCKPTLGGRDVGWFVLDTGSTQHVIAPRVSRELGLAFAGNARSTSPSGTVSARIVWAQDVALGPARWERQRFTELDLAFLSAAGEPDVAGILGYDAFAEWVLELDYRNGRLALHDPQGFEGRGLTWLPLRRVEERKLCVDVRLEGHDEVFQIDTGSNGTVLVHTPTVRRLRLLEGRSTRRTLEEGVGGASQYEVGRLDHFELAGRTWRKRMASFSILESGAHANAFPAGHFGCALLEPFVLFVDCGGERTALRPHPTPVPDPGQLVACAGTYTHPRNQDLELRVEANALHLAQGDSGPIPLQPREDGFFSIDGELKRLRFVEAGGRVVALEIGAPWEEVTRFERAVSAPGVGAPLERVLDGCADPGCCTCCASPRTPTPTARVGRRPSQPASCERARRTRRSAIWSRSWPTYQGGNERGSSWRSAWSEAPFVAAPRMRSSKLRARPAPPPHACPPPPTPARGTSCSGPWSPR